MITRPCNNCQENYQAEPRYLNRGQGLFCSRECSYKAVSETRKPPLREPNVNCSICGTKFWLKRTLAQKQKWYFCSSKCSERRSEVVRTGPQATGKYPKKQTCSSCKTPYKGKFDKCIKCYREVKSEEDIQSWLSGDNSVTLTNGKTRDTKRFVKQYLVATRGDKCEQCGFEEKAPDGRSIIQMDHINGNCLDNRPENLQLLCPNHHAMTSTYGALNRGSGRSHRRKE